MLCQQQAICKQPENWLTIYIALQNFAQHIAHCIIMLILSRSFKQEGKAQLSHVYRHEEKEVLPQGDGKREKPKNQRVGHWVTK